MSPEMVRVLHVIGPLTVGGAQTQLLGLLRAAHGTRWDATLCATAPGPLLDEFRAVGVEVIELERRKTPLGRALQLRRMVGHGEYDVLHSNLWHPNVFARLAVVGRRTRPGVVISERNVETERTWMMRAVDRLLSSSTDVWVGNSEAVCDFIRRVHPAPEGAVVHIPNAVDRTVFFPRVAKPDVGGSHRVGSVGRLFAEKGFDVLVDATRLLTQGGDDPLPVVVEVAGDGPLLDALRRRARGLPVDFVGALGRGEPVASFLRSLDVFVLPSTHREGRANVLLEALSCGVPTVATDIAGTDEAVGDGAVIVPPGNAEALATGIRRALGDPRAAERALEHSRGIADFDTLAQRYMAVFRDAIARAR